MYIRRRQSAKWENWIQILNAKDIQTAVTFTSSLLGQGVGMKLPTLDFLSYWNGAYNTSGHSSLAYCRLGAFGGMAVKGLDFFPEPFVVDSADCYESGYDMSPLALENKALYLMYLAGAPTTSSTVGDYDRFGLYLIDWKKTLALHSSGSTTRWSISNNNEIKITVKKGSYVEMYAWKLPTTRT